MTAIKVNRLQLIKSLEDAVKRFETEVVEQAEAWEAYDKARDVWAGEVLLEVKEAVVKDGYARHGIYGFNGYNNEITIRLTKAQEKRAPKQPDYPRPQSMNYVKVNGKYQHLSFSGETQLKVEQIENTLKLLKMSSEESVNASVYKSVVQYI